MSRAKIKAIAAQCYDKGFDFKYTRNSIYIGWDGTYIRFKPQEGLDNADIFTLLDEFISYLIYQQKVFDERIENL